ncbi:MAG: S26 family signal peptidase [Candidatus Binataceae bacterium]
MKLTLTRLTLIATAIAIVGTANRFAGPMVNLTHSEPTGIYLRLPGRPEHGGMVALRPLMKHVVAVPGDVVTVTAQGTYVNGQFFPHSAVPTTAKGYQPFRFGTYTLQAGQYWLLGTSPDSWDSRYIGPVPVDLIESTIRPVWTARNGYTAATRP